MIRATIVGWVCALVVRQIQRPSGHGYRPLSIYGKPSIWRQAQARFLLLRSRTWTVLSTSSSACQTTLRSCGGIALELFLPSNAPSVYALPQRLLYCADRPQMSELPPLSWGLSEEQSDMIKANKLTWHVNEKGTIIVTRK